MGRPCALLIAAALCLALAAPAVAGSRPRLAVVASSPVTVRGTGFIAHERVRVSVRTATRTVVQSARASAAGAFTVRFAAVRLGPCATIGATGSRGDRATLAQHRGVATCNPG
jgi:hypothetical protein